MTLANRENRKVLRLLRGTAQKSTYLSRLAAAVALIVTFWRAHFAKDRRARGMRIDRGGIRSAAVSSRTLSRCIQSPHAAPNSVSGGDHIVSLIRAISRHNIENSSVPDGGVVHSRPARRDAIRFQVFAKGANRHFPSHTRATTSEMHAHATRVYVARIRSRTDARVCI